MAKNNNDADFVPGRRWRFVAFVAVAALFLVLDRLTKMLIQANLRPDALGAPSFEAPLIPGLVKLFYVENTGAAFSFGEGAGMVFVLLALVVALGSVVYLWRAPLVSKVEAIGLAMVVGGGIGNAIDRLVFGYVVDFIATEFINFPVFNVADIGITCGVVIAFAGFVLFSPANHVDATAELNRRDAERSSRCDRSEQ